MFYPRIVEAAGTHGIQVDEAHFLDLESPWRVWDREQQAYWAYCWKTDLEEVKSIFAQYNAAEFADEEPEAF